MRLVRHFANR